MEAIYDWLWSTWAWLRGEVVIRRPGSTCRHCGYEVNAIGFCVCDNYEP
jgi:hypothetical protein